MRFSSIIHPNHDEIRHILATQKALAASSRDAKLNGHCITPVTDAWNSHDSQHMAAFCTADYEGENVSEATPHRGARRFPADVQGRQAPPAVCIWDVAGLLREIGLLPEL